MTLLSAHITAANEEEALETLHAAGQTDGLPVVIPTPERVERMVIASGFDADLALGNVGPNLGAAITAAIQTFSMVAAPRLGPTLPRERSASKPLAMTIRSTRSGVGITTGRPSVWPAA